LRCIALDYIALHYIGFLNGKVFIFDLFDGASLFT
jgi:hypothetical protein